MADLLPSLEKDLLPQVEGSQEYRDETKSYLSALTAASGATLQGLKLPKLTEQTLPLVSTEAGEKNIRSGMVAEETLEKNEVFDSVLLDMIAKGASVDEVNLLIKNRGQLIDPERSVLERRASKFLIEEGAKKENRANVMALEEDNTPSLDPTQTDKRQDTITTFLRINTIKERLANKFKNESIAENVLDFFALALIPGYTSLTEGKVFGRDIERLGTSVSEFTKEFWNAPLNKRMEMLDAFERDLESNAIVGQNTLSALQQIEQLLTFKNEDELFLNLTEVLDATVVGIPLARLLKGIKSISAAGKAAGANDIPVGRSIVLRQQEKEGKLLSKIDEDEFVDNAVPSSGTQVTTDFVVDSKGVVRPEADKNKTGIDFIVSNEGVITYEKISPTEGKIIFRRGVAYKVKTLDPKDIDFIVSPSGITKKPGQSLGEPDFIVSKDGVVQKAKSDHLSDFLVDSNGNIYSQNVNEKITAVINKQGEIIPVNSFPMTEIKTSNIRPFESEKPAGPVNQALTEIELQENFQKILPSLIEDAKRAGVNLDINDVNPVDLIQALKGTVVPEILSATEQTAANTAAIRELLRRFNIAPETRAIIDPELITGRAVSNKLMPTYDIEIDDISRIRTANIYLGGGDSMLKGFPSVEAATEGANRLGLEPEFYSVSDRSGEFFIKVSKNVGTTEFINVLDPKELSFVLPVIGRYVQGSKTLQSYDAKAGALLSRNASSKIMQSVTNAENKINGLMPNSRESYNNLMLEIQQSEKWYTAAQVRDWYYKNYQRTPSNKEMEAYVATRQLYEFDWVIRNSNIRKELVGAGYEEVKVTGFVESPVIGKVVSTTSLDPRLVRIRDEAFGGVVQFKTREDLTRRLHGADADTVLVKFLNPINGVDYIITDKAAVAQRPLRANLLNNINGPHRIYEMGANGGFIKQQRIVERAGQEVLVNPKTHFAIDSQKEGLEFAKKYNEALDAYKIAKTSGSGLDRAKASNIIAKNTRFNSFDEMDKAVKEGRMELTPFEFVRPGQLPGHEADRLANMKAIDPEFNALSDVVREDIDVGRLFYSGRGPRLQHPKEGLAALVHPNEIMSKAISNVVNTQAYSNYRIRQINQWVNTFGKNLVGDRNRPAIERFMYGEFDKSPNPEFPLNPVIQRQAEAQRSAIKRFLGNTGVFDEEIKGLRNQIIDLIDDNVNKKSADRFADITSANAVGFVRGVTFKAYLGMLDASQLVVQLSMFPGIVAVSPAHGSKAVFTLPFLRFALMNPKHSRMLGERANQMLLGKGIPPEAFEIMVKDIRTSGVDIIDANIGELDALNNAANIKGLASHYTKRITDAGSIFFNEAEKANRLLGYTIAWMENYSKTGKGLTTADEFAAVGLRADAFASNMAKDGKAWWQEGWLSPATQFAGHPARVAELLLHPDSGFSKTEKLRYYTGLALAYGPSLGIGGWLFEALRQKYFDATGEEPNEQVMSVMQNGMMGLVLPDTDISRLQPYGQDFLLQRFFTLSKTEGINIAQLAGPSGEIANRFYKATMGSAKLASFFTGQLNIDDYLPTAKEIVNDVLKTAASYNRIDKAITAYQLGKLYDSRGYLLQEDLNEADAAMLALGFPPRESSTAFEARAFLDDYKSLARKDAILAFPYLRKALEAPINSPDERRNLAYFQIYRDKHLLSDLTGDGGETFLNEVDKQLSKHNSYSQDTMERYFRTFGRYRQDLTRK